METVTYDKENHTGQRVHVGCCDSSSTAQKQSSLAVDKVGISTSAAISRHAFFDTIGPKPSCNL